MEEIKLLNENEIIDIFNSRMMKDFPFNERRKLENILGLKTAGIYFPYGYIVDDKLVAYAFFVKTEIEEKPFYLLDYYAVDSSIRGKGAGSIFINKLKEIVDGPFICEVENPDFYQVEEEKAKKIKRINFYYNNDFVDTGSKIKLFDVHYCILSSKTLDKKMVDDGIFKIYSSILSKELMERFFSFE